MLRREATPAAIFSLQNSEYRAFLYAPIGDGENGMVVTALSALARVGVDPWQEAATLARMPKDAASQRLSSIISGLPNGQWAQSDAGRIAAGLIALLPTPKSALAPLRGTPIWKRPMSLRVAAIVFLILLDAGVFLVLRSHDPAPAIDVGYGASSTAPAPNPSP
jgi:hypothetical protein